MSDDIQRQPSNEDGLTRQSDTDSDYDGDVAQALDFFGLTGSESEAEMKEAVRAKMSEAHPDRGGDREAFFELQDHKKTLEQAFRYSL